MEIRPVRTEADYKSALKEILCSWSRTLSWVRPMAIGWTCWPRWCRPMRRGITRSTCRIRSRRSSSAWSKGGLTPKDLEPMIGKRNRVYEVLNRKRGLTLPMIWRLHTELGIPAESLIRPPAHA